MSENLLDVSKKSRHPANQEILDRALPLLQVLPYVGTRIGIHPTKVFEAMKRLAQMVLQAQANNFLLDAVSFQDLAEMDLVVETLDLHNKIQGAENAQAKEELAKLVGWFFSDRISLPRMMRQTARIKAQIA